jgi:hypothetical protein
MEKIGPSSSCHFDPVGPDRPPGGLQDRLLGKLFRVVSRGLTVEDEAFAFEAQPEVADVSAQPAPDVVFDVCQVGSRRVVMRRGARL